MLKNPKKVILIWRFGWFLDDFLTDFQVGWDFWLGFDVNFSIGCRCFFHINLMSPNYPGNVVQLFSVIWVVACCHSHSQVAKIRQNFTNPGFR